MRVNDTFRISCYVDKADGELNFYDGDEMVPSRYITVWWGCEILDECFKNLLILCQQRTNDTYIEMTRVYARPIKKNFTCKQKWNNVGLSEVIVDERMPPVDDFKCRTKDLSTMLCSFKKPRSFLPIKYRLHFSVNDDMVSSSISNLIRASLTSSFSSIRNTNRRWSKTAKADIRAKFQFQRLQRISAKCRSVLRSTLQALSTR